MAPTYGQQRESATPEIESAWREFSKTVFSHGALNAKTKQLIAVAVAHVTQCPDCIRGHTRAAAKEGATKREILEAVWIAAEMRSGASVAHSRLALDALENDNKGNSTT